jgi:hypothetical protein
MAQRGDTIHVARYLVSGAESSSLYLEASCVWVVMSALHFLRGLSASGKLGAVH